MGRKNLNDTIHGDRATIRGHAVEYPKTSTYSGSVSEGFTDELFSKAKQAEKFGTPRSSNGNSVRDFLDHDSSWKSGKSTSGGFKSCYHTHPPLKLPGTDLLIYGGSCCSPSVTDAEVYIGFDRGMSFGQKHWPWKKGHEVLFYIPDMGTPKDPAEFKKLIKWTREQLEKGVKVHCGCIGGHGRTGTFFAALVSEYGESDAITYVRKNYCNRVVESSEQVNFLHEHFGIKKVGGSKSGKLSSGSTSSKAVGVVQSKAAVVYEPLKNEGSIFAAPAR